MGFVDPEILNYLAERVSHNLGITLKVSSGEKIPIYTYNKSRLQFNSKLILKHLQCKCTSETLAIMGITEADLYVPILKYVFGLSHIEGQCSVISLHRLNPRFYNHPFNKLLLMERAEKTLLHELGHTFGLTHCRDKQCVMYSSYNVEDTDCKKSCFCPTCLELFNWQISKISGFRP